MSKSKLVKKQDLKTADILVSLLLRFPEIFSIHLDMPNECLKFSFMLHGELAAEEYSRFQKSLADSLALYRDLTGKKNEIKAELSYFTPLSLITLFTQAKNLSLAEIQLCCGLICHAFPGKIVHDAESLAEVQNEEILQQEKMLADLLNQGARTKKVNLLAFRDAGKVFVYNK